MVKYFPRYLIITEKLAVKIEPIKYLEPIRYLGNYMPICLILHVQKKQSICDKVAFLYFT